MTTWYIHPANKVTNTEVTRRLSECAEGAAQSFEVIKLAEDGKRYGVIQVDHRFMAEMYAETKGGDYDFIAFKIDEGGRRLRFVPEFLLERSKHPKVRAAVEFVRRKRAEAEEEPDDWVVEGFKADPRVTYRKC